MLGFHLPFDVDPALAKSEGAAVGGVDINGWIVIRPDDTVIIRVARSEMGQGIMTALPMLVAEELECDWSRVQAEYASPAESVRRRRLYGDMLTGGSRSVRQSHEYLRKAGASAREMLIAAAARRWNSSPSECSAANSIITHGPSKRQVTFGAVAQDAAALEPPKDVKLKSPEQWKLIGKPVQRLDLLDKVTGAPVFGADVRLPDMVYAAIAQCPVFGGTLKRFDQASIADFKGVRKAVPVGNNAVAVVADTWWQAHSALKALKIEWDEGAHANVNSGEILQFLREGLEVKDAPVARNDGNVEEALGNAAKTIEAEYYAPFLAHATMEPMNCTAHVTSEKVEIWVPTQNGEAALAAASAAGEVDLSRVEVHKTHLGGGFGRRGAFHDFVTQAVLIARQVDRPVQLIWSREEDMQHDFFRPVSVVRFTAGLDKAGEPIAFKARVAAHSILNFVRPNEVKNGLDRHSLGGIDDMPYEFLNIRVEYAMRNTHVPVGFWRAPSHSQNGFYLECFIDELAHAAGQDPYQFRRKLLANKPKDRAVLDAAAQNAGWGKPLPSGVHRGIAMMKSYDSYCAQVAEVSVSNKGEVRVQRVVCAVDPGHVVNPDTIDAQVESAVVYGLTAVLYGDITIRNGRVQQSNFHDYPMLRIHEMPKVEAYAVPSGGFWGGMGEPPLPPLAPAVCNAVFAATGKRVRSLPLKQHDLRSS